MLSIYPISARQNEMTLRRRERFEVRLCHAGDPAYIPEVQLLGFKTDATEPALVINTGSQWIEQVIQAGTILVVQVTGGDSSPVYIAQFQKGKPVLVSLEDGAGAVYYSEEGEYAIITVPQKTFPGPDGKFPNVTHKFRLRIYEPE